MMIEEPGEGIESLRFDTAAQAKALAEKLRSAQEGDAFVRACTKTEGGLAFLATDRWREIQQKLVGIEVERQRFGPDRDPEREWDALVDRMVQLPTVKMAHEFLCQLQVDPLGRTFLSSAVWTRWARARFPEMDPRSGVIGAEPRRPQVGDDVLYMSYGTPEGEYGQEERTARVTDAGAWVDIEITGATCPGPGAIRRVVQTWDSMACSLFVMNPGGVFHPQLVEFDDGILAGSAEERADLPGGRAYRGGSWHWPRPRTTEYALTVSAPDPAQLRLEAERLAAGICPAHGGGCKTWVMTLSGGTHVGGPVE